MGFDYNKTAGTVLRLLARFGATAQLVSKASAYDPATDTTSGAEASTDCTACEVAAEKSHVDGTLIQAGHRVFLVAPQGIPEPKPGMTLRWQAGRLLQIAVCKPLAPAGVPVLYELQVKE